MQESYFVNKWQAEAILQTRRGDLTRILVSKYQQPLPAELGGMIEKQAAPEKLSGWLDLAVTMASLELFQAAIAKEGTASA